jgi:hypothetical protein
MHFDDAPPGGAEALLRVRADAAFSPAALDLCGIAPSAPLASSTVQDHFDVELTGEGLLKVVVVPLRLARDDEEETTPARRRRRRLPMRRVRTIGVHGRTTGAVP